MYGLASSGDCKDCAGQIVRYKLRGDRVRGTPILVAGAPFGSERIKQSYVDGCGARARFGRPHSMALAPDGRELVVTDCDNKVLRRVALTSDSFGCVSLVESADNRRSGHEPSVLSRRRRRYVSRSLAAATRQRLRLWRRVRRGLEELWRRPTALRAFVHGIVQHTGPRRARGTRHRLDEHSLRRLLRHYTASVPLDVGAGWSASVCTHRYSRDTHRALRRCSSRRVETTPSLLLSNLELRAQQQNMYIQVSEEAAARRSAAEEEKAGGPTAV